MIQEDQPLTLHDLRRASGRFDENAPKYPNQERAAYLRKIFDFLLQEIYALLGREHGLTAKEAERLPGKTEIPETGQEKVRHAFEWFSWQGIEVRDQKDPS